MTSTASSLLERLGPDGDAGAVSWLREHGLPTTKDEAWKYTDLKEVLATECEPLVEAPDSAMGSGALKSLTGDLGGPTVVFLDGFFSAELSGRLDSVEGLTVAELSSFTGEVPSVVPSGRVDGFHMLNRATAGQGAVVLVDPGISVPGAVHIAHVSTSAALAAFIQPRVVVHVGAASAVTLVESFVGTGGSGLVNALTEVTVEHDATVSHFKLQNEVSSINHLSHVGVRQMRGSTFTSTSFMVGAKVARASIDVVAVEDDTTTQLEGLYLPSGSQRHDNVITVEHSASHGSSTQVYKGVIDDRARGSFSGHIIVDVDTVATDAHQSNRSILLNPVAQSDSRPWLEIFADDVSCTHGSAIGRLDSDALFYLQSRGIPYDEARSILIGGFMNEIIDHIEIEALREHIAQVVSDKVSARVSADIGGDH